ncbi:MAG: molybdopterin-dependent oxidoreductase [Pseudomonadota bacterium]
MTTEQQRIPGYCALCTSRCGCISVVEEGRLVAVEPDPSHPTGSALCGKGKAAPELVHHAQRLSKPLRRTRPKGDPDPGWEEISWDEALDLVARALQKAAKEQGPESVAFGITTPSGTGLQDAYPWVERLRYAFGSPNAVFGTEICNFHRDDVFALTYGVPTPLPDLENCDCLMLWGHNPSTSWLAFATRIAAAKASGTKLIVMDPRREGLAVKADHWLRVRPGSDGALALGLAHLLIEAGAFDARFLRRWSNAPVLIREDTGQPLSAKDLDPEAEAGQRVAWDEALGGPVLYPASGGAIGNSEKLALSGHFTVTDQNGVALSCQPAFALYEKLAVAYTPERVEELTWVPAEQLRATAETMMQAKALSSFAWSGVSQHSNASQTSRAIALLYALSGRFDAPGGNVMFKSLPLANILGRDLMPEAQWGKALGLEDRPLGPEAQGWITTDALYDTLLTGKPYPVTTMVNFGTNILFSHADTQRGLAALKRLEFTCHIDLFMTPSAELADVVLPVNSPWEREGFCGTFKVGPDAASTLQLRPAVLPSLGESKSDVEIVFALAQRLGFGEQFWDGDWDASLRALLEPSGVSLEELRAAPGGLSRPQETRYRKYEETGFKTPSGLVEVFSEQLQAIGQDPLPGYVEPAMSPVSRPELAADFPLVLTTAKSLHYCHSQHRGLASLRRREPDPLVELHPDCAAERGIDEGAWLKITTPHAAFRAKAKFKTNLDPRVVSATAGWWQACEALDLPGYDAVSNLTANANAAIGNEDSDPISGSIPQRSYLCQVALEQGS